MDQIPFAQGCIDCRYWEMYIQLVSDTFAWDSIFLGAKIRINQSSYFVCKIHLRIYNSSFSFSANPDSWQTVFKYKVANDKASPYKIFRNFAFGSENGLDVTMN